MSVLPVTPAPVADADRWGTDGEPLRVRRRRELRQQIADAATRMFLERGFDAVRVSDVARACGVTEKTVFNHFPTKESLLVNRWDAMVADVRGALADPRVRPVDAAVQVLERELDLLLSPPRAAHLESHLADVARCSELVRSTPSLLAHEREGLSRLTAAAAAALGTRAGAVSGTGRDADQDPEHWIAATAVAGLWSVFYRSLHHHLRASRRGAGTDDVRQAVQHDVHRAADVLRQGL